MWYDTSSLYFEDDDKLWNVDSLNETIARYTVPKMKSFELVNYMVPNLPYIDVENMSLHLSYSRYEFTVTDFFYNNSSL